MHPPRARAPALAARMDWPASTPRRGRRAPRQPPGREAWLLQRQIGKRGRILQTTPLAAGVGESEWLRWRRVRADVQLNELPFGELDIRGIPVEPNPIDICVDTSFGGAN